MAEIDEYYKRQKEQLEQEKLNAAIQLNNARQDAMKNTQNYLRGSGYGSQGYGASQMINTNNAYNNQLGNNQNDYWSKLQELNAQQNQARQQEYTSNFENFSNSAGTFDDDSFYTQGQAYGLFKQDNTGKWQIDTENDAYKNLSLANQNALKGLVQNHENNVNSTNIGTKKFGENGEVFYSTASGDTLSDTIKNKFESHYTRLNSAIANSVIKKNGSVIEMTNKDGDKVYLQYKNGELYYIDKETYDKGTVANGKFSLTQNGFKPQEQMKAEENGEVYYDENNKMDYQTNYYLNGQFSNGSGGRGRDAKEGEIYDKDGKTYIRHNGWWYEIKK